MRKISNKEMLKIEKSAKKNKRKLPVITGKWLYTCGTIPLDVDLASKSYLLFYASIEALKKECTCWKECGIIKIKLTYYNVKKGIR